jgi:ankyrin repeat protein
MGVGKRIRTLLRCAARHAIKRRRAPFPIRNALGRRVSEFSRTGDDWYTDNGGYVTTKKTFVKFVEGPGAFDDIKKRLLEEGWCKPFTVRKDGGDGTGTWTTCTMVIDDPFGGQSLRVTGHHRLFAVVYERVNNTSVGDSIKKFKSRKTPTTVVPDAAAVELARRKQVAELRGRKVATAEQIRKELQAQSLRGSDSLKDDFFRIINSDDAEKLQAFLRSNSAFDVNVKNSDGQTALMMGSPGIIAILIKARANLDLRDENSETALMFFAPTTFTESIDLLIKAGADLDLKNKEGKTALMLAAEGQNLQSVIMLINAGANLDLQDKDDQTVLMKVVNRFSNAASSHSLIDQLIKKGASLNLQDKDGQTALTIAVKRGKTLFAKALIDAGANRELKSKDGKTALMIAREAGRQAIVDLFG